MQELLYIIYCVLLMNMKDKINHLAVDGSSGGGCPLPNDPTAAALESLGAAIDFLVVG